MVNVRLDGVYLSNPHYTPAPQNASTQMVKMGSLQWFRANEKWHRLTRLISAGKKTVEGKSIWEGEVVDTRNLSGLQCFNSIAPQHGENCKLWREP